MLTMHLTQYRLHKILTGCQYYIQIQTPLTDTCIWSHYYWVNTSRYITQNSLSNNISTTIYIKSKTKQYLLWCFNIVMWLITLYLRFLSKHYGWQSNSATKYLSGVCRSLSLYITRHLSRFLSLTCHPNHYLYPSSASVLSLLPSVSAPKLQNPFIS